MMTVVAFAAWTLVSFSGDGTAETPEFAVRLRFRRRDTEHTRRSCAWNPSGPRRLGPHNPVLTTKWTGNWQQKSDQWWLDQNTDQARVDVLLAATLTELTGAKKLRGGLARDL